MKFWTSGMIPPPTTIVMNQPLAAAVAAPSPSTDSEKMLDHITDVQRPTAAMNAIDRGNSLPKTVTI